MNAGSLIWAVTSYAAGDPAPGVDDTVSGTRALVTIGCYVLAFAVAAAGTLRRRDVI